MNFFIPYQSGVGMTNTYFRYYDRMLLEKEYQLDAQKIAEYFPVTETIQGMMRIFETLFGLEFVEVTDDSKHVWHEDTKQFRVYNEKSEGSEQTFVGWLYLDLHPREGKYGHAANFNLQPVCSPWRLLARQSR